MIKHIYLIGTLINIITRDLILFRALNVFILFCKYPDIFHIILLYHSGLPGRFVGCGPAFCFSVDKKRPGSIWGQPGNGGFITPVRLG
jgi:hypothetical protein